MRTPPPYIGVTGFTSANQIYQAAEIFPQPGHGPKLMSGILASSKTLRGGENKWPLRYPKVLNIRHLLTNDPRVMNIVHYSTDNKASLFGELVCIAAICLASTSGNLHGFQLNVAWPDPNVITKLRALTDSSHGKIIIILQIGARAMSTEGVPDSPETLVEKLRPYSGIVDYFLLDGSGGHGKAIDVERMLGYLRATRDAEINILPGVAGGLSGDTLSSIEPLLEEFPQLSFDAEGALRDSESDVMNIDKVLNYVGEALSIHPHCK